MCCIALDTAGNAYLAGAGITNFVLSNDIFVAKLNASGTSLLYSKLIGGSRNDIANSIAVDASGNVYLTGITSSTDFPTTTGAFQRTYGGGLSDAFAVKLSADGTTTLYSTYIGGAGDDRGAAIALDSNGNAFIGGSTASVDFPFFNAIQSINPTKYLGAASTTAYVAKLDQTGSHAVYSSYLGGSAGEDVRALAIDQSGNAYFTGPTASPDFPLTAGTLQAAIVPTGATFITKITDPTTCTFSTALVQPDDTGGTISVNTPGGCYWYSAKADSWVTFNGTTSGYANGMFTYSMTENPGAARSAAVSVAGQRLSLKQADNCRYTVDPIVTLFADGGVFTVNTGPGCTWTATSNVDWLTLSVSGVQSEFQVVGLSATPNKGLKPRVGTISFVGLISHFAIQTITVTQPIGATTMTVQPVELNFGLSGLTVTGPQPIIVTFSGPAQPAWTASSDQPNIKVTPASGTGNVVLQVSVSSGPSGVVTISAPSISSGVAIPVRIFSVTSSPPFGSFDTPVDNTTGVAGAIPVTGWALDNVEVTKVDIWREPVGAEPADKLVYIGDTTFVQGARPDIPPKFPATPFDYRAGWGYLMLTNFLPNNNGGVGGPGNGTYKLHALAHNKAGMTLDLGTKTIVVDNAHASRPFGSIDTPSQGATISGNAYVNFGWSLTQNPYVIPIDGSTMTVTVDGVPLGHPSYNNYRSDIATSFPGLANSSGAVGFFYIDTTTLTNGVHTIGWLVYDNKGRGDGVGSRFFNVINIGSVTAPEEAVLVKSGQPKLRRGLHTETESLHPDGGVFNVKIEELERIELDLGASRGRLEENSEERPLPIGSRLKGGVFYWQPGPGFLGDYQLVFERPALPDLKVRVTIGPKSFRPQRRPAAEQKPASN